MKNLILSAAVYVLLASNLFAQLSVSLTTDQEFNSNPFMYPESEASLVSSYQLGLENPFGNFNLGYYGNYSAFDKFSDRNFYWHQFGGWIQQEDYTAGIYAEQRLNGIDYEYFNYANATAYLRLNFSLADFYFTVNPSLTYTGFSYLDQLDNFSPAFSFRINKSPWEGTTLIGGFSFTYKDYSTYKVYTSTTDTSAGTGTYQSHGHGKGYSSGVTTTTQVIVSERELPSVTHLSSYLRIAQSLSSTTGLALQFTNGSILGGKTKSFLDIEMTYGDESDIFDDPTRFEGNSIGTEFTQILPFEIIMKLGYYYNVKKHPMDGIFTSAENYDENIQRDDIQTTFSALVKKSIALNEDEDISLDLSLQYLLLKNKSNSYWYNFDQNSFSINANLHF